MKNLEGCPTMKPKLRPNAVPDIPLTQPTTAEPRPPIPKRGGYEKRRQAEILQLANDNYKRDTECVQLQVPDSTTEPELPTSNVTEKNTSKVTMVTKTTPPPSLKAVKHKKSQSYLRPQQRTRKHQTDLKITQPSATYSTIATQTDDDITKCTCASIVTTTTNINSAQNSDDDEVFSHADSDEEYQPSDDDQSSDDDGDDNGEHKNYRLNAKATTEEQKQFLVSESALAELLSVCRYCSSEAVPVIQVSKGTLIVTNSICVNGHLSIRKSQSSHNNLPWSNLMTATAIMLSGCNATSVLRIFDHLNVRMFSMRTYNRLQSLYVSPAPTMAWDAEQSSLLEQLRGSDVILPSMDLQTKKILDFQLIQSNEVKGSTHMELEGIKRALEFLKDYVNIKEVVTDRHSSIKKYMRISQCDKKHLFDVWRVAKGVSKKSEAAAKKSGGKDIRPWIKSIVNHIYWISSSCGMDGDLKAAKWLSIMNHMCNKHEGHSSIYPKSDHGELSQDRLVEGSVPYKKMKAVVESKYLLTDVPKLSPVYQTYALEVFHSVMNNFAPKSTHFFYSSMLARLCVAALHYNENCNRDRAYTKDGVQCFSMVYPKAKKGKEAVVKSRPSPATYDYVLLIKQAVVSRKEDDCSSYSNTAGDVQILQNHFPVSLTQTFEPFQKADLIERHRSRCQR
ncbi:unnamed protein product [Mytilus coruscus]|uniref:Uncharacterized protein n=1 Tax=Mytilus coruscus TaxID=42192 RepID=A0A6J8AVK7_MYTCO|nr:unnamed protein product [Mytilus coruscus]